MRFKNFLLITIGLLSMQTSCTNDNQQNNNMQDKSLNVKKIHAQVVEAVEVPELLKRNGVEYQTVNSVNWPETYPYCPEMKFGIAYTDNAILVHYRVQEQSIRAVSGEDHGPVWEDSCVEFFSSPADDGLYYNIECNCIGTVLLAVGPDRNERTSAPKEVMDGIKRWSTLEHKTFEVKAEPTSWEVALIIPFSTYFKHKITSMDGRTIRANFYKCGDKLPEPHFLSWNPIKTDAPDFHRPDFFGTLHFAE